MQGAWFNAVVVLLWLSSMSWLAATKILPALVVGQPPSYQTILKDAAPAPVGWALSMNGKDLGWAINTTVRTPEGLTELRNRTHFKHLPLAELVPDLLQTLLSPESPLPTRIPMDANSQLLFDSLGRLVRFESAVQFEAGVDAIRIRGTTEGDDVYLSFHTGDFTYTSEFTLSRNAMVYDGLSPHARLPGLRMGQSWTVDLYSPLRSPYEPVEILIAKVEAEEQIMWNGRVVDTYRVAYRSDPGAAVGRSKLPRAELWVRPDGTVLVQQAAVVNSVMRFTRLDDAEAERLASATGAGL